MTEAVSEEVRTWQNRALEPIYGIVYLDALYVKMRHEGRVESLEGHKEVLGLWTSANEGAKFWRSVLTELKEPRCQGHVDRLRGWTEGISASH